MIDVSFIEKIEQLSFPAIHVIGEKTYSKYPLNLVSPPMPKALHTHTLSSIIDFLKAHDDRDFIVHIENETMVNITTALDEFAQRRTELVVTCVYKPFEFNRFIDSEIFCIALMSQFVVDDMVRDLVRVAGNISDIQEHTSKDDGFSQEVIFKKSLGSKESVIPPNPIELRPIRTFIEIEQPVGKYVLRFKKIDGGHACALFDADGGNWKHKAITSIAEYVGKEFPAQFILA